jgi:hypothetical protein
MYKILFTFLCVLVFSASIAKAGNCASTAKAGNWAFSAGLNDPHIDYANVDGLQASAMALNTFDRVGVGSSIFIWTGDDAIVSGFSAMVTFALVSSDAFELQLFANTPTYYNGVEGHKNSSDDINNADRSFSGFLDSHVGPIIMFAPNGGNTKVGLKVNVGKDMSGAEVVLSF